MMYVSSTLDHFVNSKVGLQVHEKTTSYASHTLDWVLF